MAVASISNARVENVYKRSAYVPSAFVEQRDRKYLHIREVAQQAERPIGVSQMTQQSPYPGGQHRVAVPAVPDNNQVDTSANAIRGPPRLWDCATTCAFFGGIDVSHFYRGMGAGRYPRPVLVSANVARWLADECEAALQRMINERDGRKRIPRRGRRLVEAGFMAGDETAA